MRQVIEIIDKIKARVSKRVIVVVVSCVIFLLLGWRYYLVNSFYFAYQRGDYRKAMEQIWTSPGASYVDLEKAGIKDVDVEKDMPDPNSFSFRFEKKGKIFDLSYVGDATLLGITEDNNANESPTLIEIEYDSNKVETIQSATAKKSQIKYYKKFAVQYMYDAEKKLYKYLDQRPGLRILKMIPFYGYFQKR